MASAWARFETAYRPRSEQPPQYMGLQKPPAATVGSNLPYLSASPSERRAALVREHEGSLREVAR